DGPTFSDLVDRPGQDDPRFVLLAAPVVPRAGRPRPPTPPWNPLAVFEEAEWIDPAAVDWAGEHNVRPDKAPWDYWLTPATYELEPGVALHITIKASYSPAEAVKVFLQLVHEAMKEVADAASKPMADALNDVEPEVLEGLVAKHLAFKEGNFIYVATPGGDHMLILVYQAYQWLYPSPNGPWVPNNQTPPAGAYKYRLKKAWHTPLKPDLPGATVEGNLANYLTPEMAHRYIDLINGPNGQDETDAWQAAADAVTATYHLLPFGSFWDNLIVQHNFYEATLSLLGDLAMFAGGPLAKAAGEGTLL